MTGPQLREALETLGWTYRDAARELEVGGGVPRIGHWVRGERPVPGYIAASVRAHLELRKCRERLEAQNDG